MRPTRTLYLDVCCLNRPLDDQTQERIRLEAESVLLILARAEAGDWEWISSDVVDFEVEQTPSPFRRGRVRLMAASAHRRVRREPAVVARAQVLEALGFRPVDALHLACAESGNADVFLTTDDQLSRLGQRHAERLRIRVANPVTWLREVMEE